MALCHQAPSARSSVHPQRTCRSRALRGCCGLVGLGCIFVLSGVLGLFGVLAGLGVGVGFTVPRLATSLATAGGGLTPLVPRFAPVPTLLVLMVLFGKAGLDVLAFAIGLAALSAWTVWRFEGPGRFRD